MSPKDIEQIDAAIVAHGQWLGLLRKAIETERSELVPEVVGLDDQCALGVWLYYGEFPASLAGSAVLGDLQQTHARFHAEAARILRRVRAGDRAGAEALMEGKGTFLALSGVLIQKLSALKTR